MAARSLAGAEGGRTLADIGDGFARPMNEIPKIVLEDPAACRLARGTNRRGDLSEEIWRLKREPGKDLIA